MFLGFLERMTFRCLLSYKFSTCELTFLPWACTLVTPHPSPVWRALDTFTVYQQRGPMALSLLLDQGLFSVSSSKAIQFTCPHYSVLQHKYLVDEMQMDTSYLPLTSVHDTGALHGVNLCRALCSPPYTLVSIAQQVAVFHSFSWNLLGR